MIDFCWPILLADEICQLYRSSDISLGLRSHRHECKYEYKCGFALRLQVVSVVCQSYKLHPHECSVRGHLYKHITQRCLLTISSEMESSESFLKLRLYGALFKCFIIITVRGSDGLYCFRRSLFPCAQDNS